MHARLNFWARCASLRQACITAPLFFGKRFFSSGSPNFLESSFRALVYSVQVQLAANEIQGIKVSLPRHVAKQYTRWFHSFMLLSDIEKSHSHDLNVVPSGFFKRKWYLVVWTCLMRWKGVQSDLLREILEVRPRFLANSETGGSILFRWGIFGDNILLWPLEVVKSGGNFGQPQICRQSRKLTRRSPTPKCGRWRTSI